MTAKHTPGPWEVRKYPEMPNRCVIGSVLGSGGQGIAHTVGLGKGTDEANAQLMAAAPELLEALEACVKDAEKCVNPGTRMYGYEESKAAIRKATGR